MATNQVPFENVIFYYRTGEKWHFWVKCGPKSGLKPYIYIYVYTISYSGIIANGNWGSGRCVCKALDQLTSSHVLAQYIFCCVLSSSQNWQWNPKRDKTAYIGCPYPCFLPDPTQALKKSATNVASATIRQPARQNAFLEKHHTSETMFPPP